MSKSSDQFIRDQKGLDGSSPDPVHQRSQQSWELPPVKGGLDQYDLLAASMDRAFEAAIKPIPPWVYVGDLGIAHPEAAEVWYQQQYKIKANPPSRDDFILGYLAGKESKP